MYAHVNQQSYITIIKKQNLSSVTYNEIYIYIYLRHRGNYLNTQKTFNTPEVIFMYNWPYHYFIMSQEI